MSAPRSCALVLWKPSPLQVFLSGCSMKPTGQLQWTPVAASWHLLSQPPLLTEHVSVWEGGGGGNPVIAGPGGAPDSRVMDSTEATGRREGLGCLPALQKEH